MAKLTGHEIKRQVGLGRIVIDPFEPRHVGPNSVDLRLGKVLLVYKGGRGSEMFLDMRKEHETASFQIPPDGYLLQPGRVYLGSTVERAGSDYYVPCIEGRSSVARLGLLVHITAGFGDLGFQGHWTLELVATQPVLIYAGIKICQVYFDTTEGLVEELYRGKYEGTAIPQPSKIWSDFSGDE